MVSIIKIDNKLRSAFHPDYLEVSDDSLAHKGHLNYKQGTVTHIKIKIKSSSFKDKTKISMHQLIYKTLAEEIKMGLHAISIEADE
ncbi:BolA family protein [Candidatus Jidaibacter acanthamoebae]|nr:BolA family protein [Candidatus Jidaibacter acanthamoeba]